MQASRRAHPRSRGENGDRDRGRCVLGGASPLTRGKPKYCTCRSIRSGRIPAHAGKTVAGPPGGPFTGAHPRSRGENTLTDSSSDNAEGASPLTRGKPGYLGHHQRRGGRIPAHAGKTDVTRARCCTTGAHPRSRGENLGEQTYNAIKAGASPLTRGKPVDQQAARRTDGRIPAHAGKTDSGKRSWIISRAHPRSRGENFLGGSPFPGDGGASPLTRGKPPEVNKGCQTQGRIPAHAGKTHTERTKTHAYRAHPRSRGENMKKADAEALKQGASPLTRGKRW